MILTLAAIHANIGLEIVVALLCFLAAIAFMVRVIWQIVHNTICIVTTRMCRFIPIGDGFVFSFAAVAFFALGGVFAP